MQCEYIIKIYRPIFKLTTQTRTRLILEQVCAKYCSRNTWQSNAQVSNRYSSMFYNHYLTGVDSQVSSTDGKNVILTWFIKTGRILVLLLPPCAFTALWEADRGKIHTMSSISGWGSFPREQAKTDQAVDAQAGYSPLNMHEHSPRLFRGTIHFTLEPSWPRLSIIMIRILDFVVYTKKINLFCLLKLSIL